ncbi:hypothetical protein ACWT_5228 [Actinoplanes sp. SE50]|uniref:hypothetical protein n=1 Tax=unclassified Actinoplanes TaxID=2626549 RepID=UPI00023EBBFE|nr:MULTISPECIES: hypothetical protein [unclassified Actinoplanes]AEV86245.1 hypothetical protein ACPL_5358 [Actinoplanes sp. SE50/110]ATO84643.1 hypothetical protein ACWT_5228 [Actinoplanes sp. SE50]SLM02053.1 hypothetical protein ACSP50_5291 [Actinoplanes sp. SE50/110]
MIRQQRHPASWWDQFQQASDKFDLAILTESLGDEIAPKISSPLLRREAEIALEVMVRHLNKPASEELAERATKGVQRLVETVARLQERSGDGFELREAQALIHLLEGKTGDAASEAEEFLKSQVILRAFVAALRLERFDSTLAVKLLAAGHDPAAALHSGQVIGKYAWWPSWLLKVVTERAMAGTLDEDTVAALDRCAYAELSPAQARMARRLLDGEEALIDASSVRLEALGEVDSAEKLRKGDLTMVALAARLIPI